MQDLYVVKNMNLEKRVRITREILSMFKSDEDDYLNKVLHGVLEDFYTSK